MLGKLNDYLLRKLLVGKTWAELNSIISRENGSRIENLRTNPKSQIEAYRSWVYSCVSLISDRISVLPFGFYNKITKQELNSRNRNFSVFTKPFYNPNPLMSFRFIKSWCQIQLDLCGMTCIYKGVNVFGQVWEIWPLNMNDFVKAEVGGTIQNPSVKYIFSNGSGRWIDYDINELIVLNYPHPTNPWIGMSPIQAQAYASDTDTYIEVYERDFFKKGARIDMALVTDTQLNAEKADEIKSRWLSKFQGKFHEVAVLDQGLKPVPVKFTNRDFEFLQLANWTKEKILGAYKVPANKLGSTESNRAGSVYTDISFNRESIHPRTNLWDEELTMGVCSTFDDRLCIQHQNPIPRDRQLEVQESKAYVGIPTLTINEFRKKVHKLEDVEGGDVIVVPEGHILLSDLEKYSKSKLTQLENSGKPNEDDRDREDEESHVNPDGTDDRDDNPTDGRSVQSINEKSLDSFHTHFVKFRPIWFSMVFDALKGVEKAVFKKRMNGVLLECMVKTVGVLLDYYGYKSLNGDFNGNEWISGITEQASKEFMDTLVNLENGNAWKTMFESNYKSNARISKILNALLRSSINYSKWLVLNAGNKTIKWVVNGNECGHAGRLEKMECYGEDFKVGNTLIQFPGCKLNFLCDCTITDNKIQGE